MTLPASRPQTVLIPQEATFASVELTRVEGGHLSQWWISRAESDRLNAVAYLEIPVGWDELELARRYVHGIGTQLIMTFDYSYDQDASAPISHKPLELHMIHHITRQARMFTGMTEQRRMAILYDFARQMGERTPTVPIGKALGVPASSVRKAVDSYHKTLVRV